MSIIKDKIRELRGNVSQNAFGKILGVGQSTIAGYELGTRTPDVSFILKICEKFSVTPNYLLGFDDAQCASSVAQSVTVNSPVHTSITTGNAPEDIAKLRQEVSRLKDELIAQLRESAVLVRENAELKMRLAGIEK